MYNREWASKQKDPEFLFFYGEKGRDLKSSFSQWFPIEFNVDGLQYLNSEQYMMSEKALLFDDMRMFNNILKTNSPALAKSLGKKVKNFDPVIWDEHKRQIVVEGNLAKFSQNPVIRDFLLSTGDKILVEASPYDTIWGIGLREDNTKVKDVKLWRGENLLGFVLMDVRDIIRKETH